MPMNGVLISNKCPFITGNNEHCECARYLGRHECYLCLFIHGPGACLTRGGHFTTDLEGLVPKGAKCLQYWSFSYLIDENSGSVAVPVN